MIERIARLIGKAFGYWLEGEREYTGWMRVYPRESGEHIKVTVGFYDIGQEYIGSVTVIEDQPGAELQFEIDIPPYREG